MKFISNSYEDSVNFGMEMGKKLNKNDVICLYGDLGSGKTAFVTGILKTFGCEDSISSPTFTIVNEYNSNPQIFHFDVYRVYDPEELYAIGFEDYFTRDGIVIIEWANLIEDILPKKRINVYITKSQENENIRFFELQEGA